MVMSASMKPSLPKRPRVKRIFTRVGMYLDAADMPRDPTHAIVEKVLHR